ncbi:hypothetical protein [Neoroseomonas soli]|uniref:J domain-containing protein n=1 Tax=Neoroseomonas soli TaxID=1081025 RepID=A0A9X9WZE0_9PROT|nr:hypothetical protein [Neoroseomonas soli]MBR0672519.1 hypothetical protein [Neoroseomonas soli]
METDRPFREWPLEQLAEQAALHAADRKVLAALLAEAALRPGQRAIALRARLSRMQEGLAPDAPAGELRLLLAAAATEIEDLRARLRAAEAALAARPPACEAVGEPGPHRRVYLTPNAPAWLVAEVRRAFRRRYHPDAHNDSARRRRAEDVFKRAEAVFAEIEKLS